MGQYHLVVNLDRQEFLHPHDLGDGLKLLEFGCSGMGTMLALAALLDAEEEGHGAWAGNRIAIVGDYAEPDDLPAEFAAETIYLRCTRDEREWADRMEHYTKMAAAHEYGWNPQALERLVTLPRYRNVSAEARDAVEADGLVRFSREPFGDKVGPALRINSWDPDPKGRPLVVVNLDKRLTLDPAAFGDTPTFDRFAYAWGGSTLMALALLLGCSAREGGRGGGDPRFDQERIIGSWAGNRLVITAADEVSGGTDISPAMRHFLAENGGDCRYEVTHEGVRRLGWGGQPA
jgi:hypothetical protein